MTDEDEDEPLRESSPSADDGREPEVRSAQLARLAARQPRRSTSQQPRRSQARGASPSDEEENEAGGGLVRSSSLVCL